MHNKVLLEAYNAHVTRTKHKGTFIGVNSVRCLECKKHAHIAADGRQLILHGRYYQIIGPINAQDF